MLVELAGGKKATGRNQDLLELIHDGGFADSRIARDQHQIWLTGGDDLIKGIQKCFDLSIAPVQFFGNQ